MIHWNSHLVWEEARGISTDIFSGSKVIPYVMLASSFTAGDPPRLSREDFVRSLRDLEAAGALRIRPDGWGRWAFLLETGTFAMAEGPAESFAQIEGLNFFREVQTPDPHKVGAKRVEPFRPRWRMEPSIELLRDEI
jgi:hypothetical protein